MRPFFPELFFRFAREARPTPTLGGPIIKGIDAPWAIASLGRVTASERFWFFLFRSFSNTDFWAWHWANGTDGNVILLYPPLAYFLHFVLPLAF